jgi:hypothetical protein
MQFGIRQYELVQYPVGMKRHRKMTTPKRGQITWWVAGGIAIREKARRLAEFPPRYSLQTSLKVFTAHIMQGVRIET